jgi:hypothetical protein
VDLDQICARVEHADDGIERLVDLGIGDRRPDPRPARVAEHREQLAARGPIRVDPLDRRVREAPGFLLRDRATIGLPKQLGFEAQIDRARGDVERETLRREVVLDEGHRERHDDPATEPAATAAEVAIDRRPCKRPALHVETADPEQPQERPLSADRRRGAGARSPGAGQGLRVFGQPVDRPERRGDATHRRHISGTCRPWRGPLSSTPAPHPHAAFGDPWATGRPGAEYRRTGARRCRGRRGLVVGHATRKPLAARGS